LRAESCTEKPVGFTLLKLAWQNPTGLHKDLQQYKLYFFFADFLLTGFDFFADFLLTGFDFLFVLPSFSFTQ